MSDSVATERELCEYIVREKGRCYVPGWCTRCPVVELAEACSSSKALKGAKKWLKDHPVEEMPLASPPDPTLGCKDDAGKLQWSLVPFREWNEVVKVLTVGAVKYAPDNWKYVKDGKRRYVDAFFRHVVAMIMGEKNDPEDNLPHWAHAICCLLFIGWLETEGK